MYWQGIPPAGCKRRTVEAVDNRAEVREFLISRRAKITPAQAGLPEIGARRVPGLRRGEVAALAGVSIEYYAKLERGALAGVSASVLDALARALQLDDAERAHLFHLAHAADGTSAGHAAPTPPEHALDSATVAAMGARPAFTAPAIIRNGRMDLLATNHLGRAMHAIPVRQRARRGRTELRPVHLPARSTRTGSTPTGTPPPTPAWPSCVPKRAATPTTRHLHDLVGELSTRSDGIPSPMEFAQRAAARRRRQDTSITPSSATGAGVRERRHDRRPRPDAHRLRCRTRLTYRPRTRPTRVLGGHHCGGRLSCGSLRR